MQKSNFIFLHPFTLEIMEKNLKRDYLKVNRSFNSNPEMAIRFSFSFIETFD